MKLGDPKSAIFVIIIGVLLFSMGTSYAYDVPTGIPDPTSYFDGFDPLNAPAPTVNPDGSCDKCLNWPSSENPGCYFIDNTDPNATDTNNPYGYPDKPRLTIPEIAYSAGDFIYINQGTYSPEGDRFNWGGVGTATSPIWFCGNPSNRPKLPEYVHFYIDTDYFIVDNIEFPSNGRIDLRPTSSDIAIKHLVIRNCLFEGTQNDTDGSAITVGQTTGDPYTNSFISDVVVYNNHLQNYGDVYNTEECGVYMGYPTERLWVLKNEIHHFGADGVAGCHNADHGSRYSRYYFIGDNKIYDNGENSIDLKTIQHYVVSHNNLEGPYYRENGWSIVLHYGANSLGCTYGWVIFNEIHNSGGGVAITNVDEETHVLGNLIYNIADESSSSDSLDGAGIGFRGLDGKLIVTNNTIYGYETYGIICDQEVLNSEDTVIIENNILANRSGNGNEIRIDANGDRVTIRNNLYHYPQGTASFYWEDETRDLNCMKSISQCQGGVEGDPRFVNPPNDFSLQQGSPAIDKGDESSAYATFQAEYSLDIKKDFLGTSRPQGSAWDIGTYEYVWGNFLGISFSGGISTQ